MPEESSPVSCTSTIRQPSPFGPECCLGSRRGALQGQPQGATLPPRDVDGAQPRGGPSGGLSGLMGRARSEWG